MDVSIKGSDGGEPGKSGYDDASNHLLIDVMFHVTPGTHGSIPYS